MDNDFTWRDNAVQDSGSSLADLSEEGVLSTKFYGNICTEQ